MITPYLQSQSYSSIIMKYFLQSETLQEITVGETLLVNITPLNGRSGAEYLMRFFGFGLRN